MVEKNWFRVGGALAGIFFVSFVVVIWNYTDFEFLAIGVGFVGTVLASLMIIRGAEYFSPQRRIFLMSASVTVLLAAAVLCGFLLFFVGRQAGFW